MNTDIVIAYVNMDDINWQKQYYWYNPDESISKSRFRDYGTLKYVFRGIDTYMKFINNVYLIISSESQIPTWLNKNCENLHIIYHKDFIPDTFKEFIPTFNCNVLEANLHNIPGLSEQFIYANDDMIPIAELNEYDFFQKGKPCISWNETSNNASFYSICLQSDYLAKISAGIFSRDQYNDKTIFNKNNIVKYPQHTLASMLKSENEKCNEPIIDLIKKSYNNSRIRQGTNMNQYMYTFYYYYTNNYVWQPLSVYYNRIGSNKESPEDLENNIINAQDKTLCINDSSHIYDIKEWNIHILNGLEYRLPNKSIYEL